MPHDAATRSVVIPENSSNIHRQHTIVIVIGSTRGVGRGVLVWCQEKGYTDLTKKVGKLNENKVGHVISIMQNPRLFPEKLNKTEG